MVQSSNVRPNPGEINAKNQQKNAGGYACLGNWPAGSGLGVKIGGLGVVVEELPPELVKAAARQGIELEVETLTPCFAHYDRSQLTKLDVRLPVTLEGYTFDFEVYEHIFPDGQKVIYFWDEWQSSWTHASAIYPDDPQMGHYFVCRSQSGYGRLH